VLQPSRIVRANLSISPPSEPSTIGHRAAAIAHPHKLAGHEPPPSTEAVKAVLREIPRTDGTAEAPKARAHRDAVAH
jgi:hypothetical protein